MTDDRVIIFSDTSVPDFTHTHSLSLTYKHTHIHTQIQSHTINSWNLWIANFYINPFLICIKITFSLNTDSHLKECILLSYISVIAQLYHSGLYLYVCIKPCCLHTNVSLVTGPSSVQYCFCFPSNCQCSVFNQHKWFCVAVVNYLVVILCVCVHIWVHPWTQTWPIYMYYWQVSGKSLLTVEFSKKTEDLHIQQI